jgi:hypothetical protein
MAMGTRNTLVYFAAAALLYSAWLVTKAEEELMVRWSMQSVIAAAVLISCAAFGLAMLVSIMCLWMPGAAACK